MTESKKPTYTILSAREGGPLVRIGALWATKNEKGFSGKLDCVPMHSRVVAMPADTKNPPPTAARPVGKAPVYRLFSVAGPKAPLVAIGSLWHTADARGYQGVLDVAPLNGRIMMFEHHSSPENLTEVPEINWDDPTPF